MQTQVKTTIFRLKEKVFSRYKEVGLLRAKIKRQEARLASLEAVIETQKHRLEPQQVPNHVYPAQMVALAIFIVVVGGGSLRCASKSVAFFLV